MNTTTVSTTGIPGSKPTHTPASTHRDGGEVRFDDIYRPEIERDGSGGSRPGGDAGSEPSGRTADTETTGARTDRPGRSDAQREVRYARRDELTGHAAAAAFAPDQPAWARSAPTQNTTDGTDPATVVTTATAAPTTDAPQPTATGPDPIDSAASSAPNTSGPAPTTTRPTDTTTTAPTADHPTDTTATAPTADHPAPTNTDDSDTTTTTPARPTDTTTTTPAADHPAPTNTDDSDTTTTTPATPSEPSVIRPDLAPRLVRAASPKGVGHPVDATTPPDRTIPESRLVGSQLAKSAAADEPVPTADGADKTVPGAPAAPAPAEREHAADHAGAASNPDAEIGHRGTGSDHPAAPANPDLVTADPANGDATLQLPDAADTDAADTDRTTTDDLPDTALPDPAPTVTDEASKVTTGARTPAPGGSATDVPEGVAHSAERRAAAHAQANELLARAELRRVTHGGSRLDLETDAGELGVIRIEATDRGNGLHLQLGSERSSTRTVLGDHLQELRDQLRSDGFDLGSLDVGTGAGGRHGAHTSTEPSARVSTVAEGRPSTAMPLPTPTTTTVVTDGIDLRL